MILLSHDIFAAQRTGGISRCFLELFAALEAQRNDVAIWAGGHHNLHLTETLAAGRIAQVTQASPVTGRIYGAWRNERPFAASVRATAGAVVQRSYHPVWDALDRHVPVVETVHDLWDEIVDPRQDRVARLRSLIKRRALRRADHIVCVSHATRDALVQRWPWTEAKSSVIYHGATRLTGGIVPYVSDRPFFLFVGRRGYYKNFDRALAALAAAPLRDVMLRCVGSPFTLEEQERITAAGLFDRVVVHSSTDAELAGLYEAALGLLYPSRYEGFGLPLLEAMAHGCPVIASNASVLPEVGGDAALYAGPDDLDGWIAGLVQLAQNSDIRADLIARGYRRAAMFDWADSARRYSEIYDRLCV